jgi:nucleotide-binding universal stress UspA family protein
MNSEEAGSATTRHPYTVVVGVDFSDAGDEAFREAAALATRTFHSELHVVHVVDNHAMGSPRSDHFAELADKLTQMRDRVAAYVSVQSRRMPALAGQIVGIHVRVGPTSRALLQLAADLEADIIAVGGDSASSLKKFLSTSLSQRLLKLARCPVLVAVRKDYSREVHSPSIEPACTDCLEMRRATGGTAWWCQRHAVRHLHAHTYSYRSRMPFETHDSEVIPTGVNLS